MKIRYAYCPFVIMFAVTVLIWGCRKDDDHGEAQLPAITTENVSNIGQTTATCGGTVSSDGGAKITERGICWGTVPEPGITDNKTTEGTGSGKFVSTLTGLSVNTLYYCRAYATNSEGTAYGDVKNFTTRTASFTDIDGNTYNSQMIGAQEWMAENLKVTKFNDGSPILLISDSTAWDTLSEPAYCWFENDPLAYKGTYGALYNWYTINTDKLCPEGWHVPSNEEWLELTNYLGGEYLAGGKLKDPGELYWNAPNTSATNVSGFTGLPGGLRGDRGTFGYMGYLGAWWSSNSSVYYQDEASFWTLTYNSGSLISGTWPKVSGFSVRCLKN